MPLVGCRIFSGGAALCLWALSATADGFRNPPDTAAALGEAGNHVAWVDDASAVLYNPANLVDVPSTQVQLSSMFGYSHADYSGQLGTADTESPWGILPGFALAGPLHATDNSTDWAYGLGLHVPYGRQTHWDPDSSLRYAAPISTKLTVADLSPSLSWRVCDSVSIGAGPDFYYGQLRFRQLAPFTPQSRMAADMDGYGFGGNAGITWRMTESQRLALTYRSPFDMKFRGDLKTTEIPISATDSCDADTTFRFPTIVALAYGVQLTDTWRIEPKAEWLQFSRYKRMSVHAGDNEALVQSIGLGDSPQNWDDTVTLGIGTDWTFAPHWTARAGYLYLPSPIPDSTFAPTSLDVDQSIVSTGLGYSRGHHAVDLAYSLGIFDKRTVGYNQSPLYQNSTYEFEGHLIALTYTYTF
jgi:long-chain fatty acid transport protein